MNAETDRQANGPNPVPLLLFLAIPLVALIVWACWPKADPAPPRHAGITHPGSTQPVVEVRDNSAMSPGLADARIGDKAALAPPEPRIVRIEFPESPEEEDPYVIRPFISEPESSDLIRPTTAAPATGATYSHDTLVGGEIVDPEPQWAPAIPMQPSTAPEPEPEPVIRAREYRGSCPAGSSARNPVDWQQWTSEARSAFPRPRLGAISYGVAPEKSFVVVGTQIVHEGQLLPSGGVLLQLGSKTLVMSSGGCVVAIPLRALSR